MKVVLTSLFLLFSASLFSLEFRAVVKIQKRTLFSSDLNSLLKEVKAFSCLKSKSSLLSELSGLKSLSNRKISTTISWLKDNSSSIETLISLVKIQMVSNSGNTSYSRESLDELLKSGCFKKDLKLWGEGLKSLIQTELYLRDRLKKGEEFDEILKQTNKLISHELLF